MLGVAGLVAWGAHNAGDALARRNIDVDFAFLLNPAGFDIPFRLTTWESSDSYGRALLVAGLNTALASVLAILLATGLGLVLALMRLARNPLAAAGTGWDLPAMRGFNFAGGWRLPPELLALVLGVGIYTAAFVSENVRASIGAVGAGQREAARSLGLPPGRTMRLVVLPQALRTLLPPLTSHYLNIIKSTTLGAAIAYPEILQIFARTVLNQSGRAIETMTLVLGVFLAVNLGVSALMNRWDRRLARQSR